MAHEKAILLTIIIIFIVFALRQLHMFSIYNFLLIVKSPSSVAIALSLLRVTTYGSPIFCSKCYHPTSTSTAGGPRSFYRSIYNPFMEYSRCPLLHYCCPSSGFHLLRWWVHTFNHHYIPQSRRTSIPLIPLEKQGMPLFTHFRLARPLDMDTGHLAGC